MAQYIPSGLEERVEFASWQRPEPESERFRVQDPTLSGDEIPGWTLLRSRHIHVPDALPFIRSTWSRSPTAADPLLLVDVYIADSPASARMAALRVLADFQSPLLARRTDDVVGEVAFGDGSPNWILFVRGNLVVWTRNGGRAIVPVLDAARALDASFVSRAGGGQAPG